MLAPMPKAITDVNDVNVILEPASPNVDSRRTLNDFEERPKRRQAASMINVSSTPIARAKNDVTDTKSL